MAKGPLEAGPLFFLFWIKATGYLL